ncbi:MAG: ImmA/IrrE family metallo-endopeptidase [Thermomicrobiales bacterium]|nr:ImmA/IrrE family metallo-endopeptidase [Thermomicrobiales bacterium]
MPTEFLSDYKLESSVLALVHNFRDEYNLPSHVPVSHVLSTLGLTLRYADLGVDRDGMLKGREVLINSRVRNAARAEYTIFHEVMHHLLDQDGTLYEYLTEKLPNDEVAFDRAIERWCQIGAAEFVLPRVEVHRILERDGFSVTVVPTMRHELGASLVACGIQLAECAPVKCYVLICRHGRSPRFPYPTTLYVEQASFGVRQKYPIAKGTVIPKPHIFWDAWELGKSQAPTSVVPFRSGRSMPCKAAEAVRVDARVVGLLCLENPISPSQLPLL